MKLPVQNADGKEVRKITVDDSVFGIAPNVGVLHQAFEAQRANQRRGTASTKTRSEVQGSTAKVRRQKYTGRARVGTNRSPTRVGGGVAFGPRPRSYAQALPKKMRRLAIRSALSGKVADGQLHVIDSLGMDSPRTKEMLRILRNSGIERSVLIVTEEPNQSVRVSARNLQKTKVLPAPYLNVVDLVVHRDLLLTEEAVRRIEGLWAVEVKKPLPAKAGPKKKPPDGGPSGPARRTRRKKEETPVEETEAAVEAEAAAPEAAVEEKPRPARRARRPKAKAEEPAAGAAAAEKPKPRRSARPKKEPEPEEEA